jgi:anti-anti-sigma factor
VDRDAGRRQPLHLNHTGMDGMQMRLEAAEPHVLVIRGELDAATAPALAARLAAEPSIRVIDLRHVTFVDARGLRPLLLRASREEPGAAPTLRTPSRVVWRLLTLTGLEEAFNIE